MGSRFRKFDADHAQQVSQTPSFESGVQQGDVRRFLIRCSRRSKTAAVRRLAHHRS